MSVYLSASTMQYIVANLAGMSTGNFGLALLPARQGKVPGMAAPHRQRHWYQFGLRTMVVVMTLLCVGPGGYVAYEQHKVRKGKTALEAIEKLGGVILFDPYEEDEIPTRSPVMAFLLGDDQYARATLVDWTLFSVVAEDGYITNVTHRPTESRVLFCVHKNRAVQFASLDLTLKDRGKMKSRDCRIASSLTGVVLKS